MGTPQTIELNAGIGGEPLVEEKIAAAGSAIKPGYLIEVATGEVQEHSTAATNAQKMFALTNLTNGSGIDTAYTVATLVRCGTFKTGQGVYALLAAAAPAIVEGDALESAGDGTLRKAVADAASDTAQRDAIVAYAAEAVDNSGGGSEARIKIKVA